MKNTEKADKRTLRQFGLAFGAFFGLFLGCVLPWLWSFQWMLWPWAVAGFFALIALSAPQILGPFYVVWMRVADVLGWINTRIILGVAFLLLFSTLGFIMRMMGKDPLQKDWNPRLNTYRTPKPPRGAEHMERPF